MKIISKFLAITLISYSLSANAQQKANFSGEYILNKTKTTFGEKPEFVLAKKLLVTQNAKEAIITRINLTEELKEKAPVTDSIAFNGAIYKRPMPGRAASVVSSSIKWINGVTLEISQEAVESDGKLIMKTLERWSQEDDGTIIKIMRCVKQGDDFHYDITGYYDKTKR